MKSRVLGRIASITVASIILSLFVTGPAAAFALPVDGQWRCTHIAAGYGGGGTGSGGGDGSGGGSFLGSLDWQVCIVRNVGGLHLKVQLSSLDTLDDYRFLNGTIYFRLQRSFPGLGTSTLASDRVDYDYLKGTLSGDSFYFPQVVGTLVPDTKYQYRVSILSYYTAVWNPSITTWIAMSEDGIGGIKTINSPWWTSASI